jgi:hypothetical protein
MNDNNHHFPGSPYYSRTATFDRGEYTCSTNPNQADYQTMTRPGYLSFIPPGSAGPNLNSALRLCSSTGGSNCTLTDPLNSMLTATVTSQVSVARFGAGDDPKFFSASVGVGLMKVSVAAVPPIDRCDQVFQCRADPAHWFRSNLNWQLSILDSSGSVVAGPVGNNFTGSQKLTSADTTTAAMFAARKCMDMHSCMCARNCVVCTCIKSHGKHVLLQSMWYAGCLDCSRRARARTKEGAVFGVRPNNVRASCRKYNTALQFICKCHLVHVSRAHGRTLTAQPLWRWRVF